MKTKRNLIQVCLLWAALLPAAVQAQFTYDGFGFTTNNGTITITNYTGPGGAVTIPSNIVVNAVSLPVTSIGGEAFFYCTNLSDITIPNSVTSIGIYAFYFCASLTNVTIPNSVTSIEDFAFSGCASLTGVTIPDSVTSIGRGAFQSCGSLTGVTIPASVTSIMDAVFQSCTSLRAIMVAANNPAYSSVAGVLFNLNQTTLVEYPAGKSGSSYAIPASVASVEDYAFTTCASLTNINIGTHVTSIGMAAFQSCGSLTGVTIPNSVTSIGEDTFQGCFKLTGVTIPNSVTNIGEEAFVDCSSLTSVTIPNRVTSIGDEAFASCSSLTNVTIPDRVTSIGFMALSFCSSLTSVTIGTNVTSLGIYAFYDCSSLTSVTIPISVTNIGYEAFASCYSLTNATIHGNAPSADSSVFYNDLSATVYFYPGTSGWGSTFGGAPTVMLNPPLPAGSLQVTITPAWAVSAGAQWQVDGGILQPGGATVLGLSATKHTVSFTAISGCTKPANQTVWIIAGQTNYLIGAYSDTTRPTVSITNVTAGMNVSNAAFTVKGKCGDSVGVTNVLVSVNQGAWNPATWPNNGNWWEPVSLTPGTNTLRAYAVDAAGNVSTTNTVKLIYLLRAPLDVQIVGEGVLTPDDNGDLLAIGENYRMKAKATNGFAFYYWGGGVTMTTNTTLTFTMAANLTIIAHFVDVTKPVATITFPVANQKWSNSVITATGKASDNVGVTEVGVQINNGGWVTADTVNRFTNWTAPNLPVRFGTNILQAYAVDGAGNASVTNEVKFIGDLNPLAGMALIPAGMFTMGDTLDGEGDALPTNVTVSAFYMDTNLVSYSQWQAVYDWATSQAYDFTNAGAGQAADQPVYYVDWFDCLKWCNARSAQAGLTPVYYTDAGLTQMYTNGETDAVYANWAANGYRLPTEAEWEKAARGGLSGQRFPWGDNISESQANYYAEPGTYAYDLGPYSGFNTNFYSGGEPYTSPVGYFAANGYGLTDMAGNVWEWCWDWYGTPYGQPTGTNPTGPGTGSYRVQRGGGWSNSASLASCAFRGNFSPDEVSFNMGFRCVRGL